MTCDPQSKLRKCQNGMTCDLQTRKCSLPRKPTKCQIEFYNKMQLKKPGITFDFQDDNGCHHSDIEYKTLNTLTYSPCTVSIDNLFYFFQMFLCQT